MHVGLSAWIIQDGNYDEFEAGQEYRFALAFYPHEISMASGPGRTPLIRHEAAGVHHARGTIIYSTDRAWVVDFGIPAFEEAKPPEWAKPGVTVCGRVYIGVDPFFYFETLKNEKGMPDLFRHWFLRRIWLETTPWIENKDVAGRKMRTRDDSRQSFVEVPATDAWKHDNGLGHYVLECELRNE